MLPGTMRVATVPIYYSRYVVTYCLSPVVMIKWGRKEQEGISITIIFPSLFEGGEGIDGHALLAVVGTHRKSN